MDGRERNLAIYRNPLHLIIINNINNDKDIDTRRNVNPPEPGDKDIPDISATAVQRG